MIDQFYCVNQMVCKNEVKKDNAPIGLLFTLPKKLNYICTSCNLFLIKCYVCRLKQSR
jgi:hypothetical protein